MIGDHRKLIQELIDSFGTWFHDEKRLDDGKMTDRLFPYTHLFSPIQVNSVSLKNRIVMGPLGNVNMVEETGRPGTKMVQFLTERAKGGAGLLTSGMVPVSYNVEASLTEPGNLTMLPRIDRSRTVFSKWRELAENIHAHGARFFIQLSPGVGRVGSPECLVKKFRLPVSASWNPNFYLPAIPCRPLRDGEALKIIKNAGQAAADAKAMQIDGVYLHGHEGYLLEQMTNTAFNRRLLGRYRHWQTFGIRLVEQIRQRCGPDYPIMYRIDMSLALKETYGERMDHIKTLKKFRNERTVAMTLQYMANLVKAGVDMFDIDLGCYDNWWLPHPPGPMPPGLYLPLAQVAKDYFKSLRLLSNAGLPVPIVAVGKLGYPDLAERALREQLCDMVMLARPLLADPEWPNKAYAGRVRQIRPCIGDQEACLNEFLEGGHPQCAVNPLAGFEDVPAFVPVPATRPRKIAVVGAGPAGIICATTAAYRGHRVTLFERADRLGGQLVPGSIPRFKSDIACYLQYLQDQIMQAARERGLTLRLGVEATQAALKAGQFESVVICTGAQPLLPPLPGIDLPHVVQAVELLRNTSISREARRVIVIGGGILGCETALMLASEMNKRVIIIEMQPHLMKGVCTANRGHLIHHLEKAGVQLMNCARVKNIDSGKVNILRNASRTVPNPYNTWSPLIPENVKNPLARRIRVDEREEELETDLVVLAAGFVSDDGLYRACLSEHIAPDVRRIGDCFQPGRVFEAVKAGYATGRAL